MKYDNALGIFGNIKRLYGRTNAIDNNVIANRQNAEQTEFEIMANMVESVIDEFHAFVGEEEEDV